MPGTQIEQVRDDELRALIQQAKLHLDADENPAAVRACADAYLKLLGKRPEVLSALHKILAAEQVSKALEVGSLRFSPLMWPRLGAKLHLPQGKSPEIGFDREHFGFGEAIQYYEFTINLILDAEKGQLQTEVRPVGL